MLLLMDHSVINIQNLLTWRGRNSDLGLDTCILIYVKWIQILHSTLLLLEEVN